MTTLRASGRSRLVRSVHRSGRSSENQSGRLSTSRRASSTRALPRLARRAAVPGTANGRAVRSRPASQSHPAAEDPGRARRYRRDCTRRGLIFRRPLAPGFGEAEPSDERTRERDLGPTRRPRAQARPRPRSRARPAVAAIGPIRARTRRPGAEELSSPELPPGSMPRTSSGVPGIDDRPAERRAAAAPRRARGDPLARRRVGTSRAIRYPPAEPSPARAQSPPGELETERDRAPPHRPRPADPERRRPPEPPSRREHAIARPRSFAPARSRRRARLRPAPRASAFR